MKYSYETPKAFISGTCCMKPLHFCHRDKQAVHILLPAGALSDYMVEC